MIEAAWMANDPQKKLMSKALGSFRVLSEAPGTVTLDENLNSKHRPSRHGDTSTFQCPRQ